MLESCHKSGKLRQALKMEFKHPKYYKELAKKRKEFEREQADKRASEQADKQGSEQASSDQASDEDSSNKR